MKTAKKLLGLAGAFVLSTTLSGCIIGAPLAAGTHALTKGILWSTPGSEPNDTFGSWWDDMASDFHHSWRAMGRDIRKAHRTFDRVFLNYDWEDPYL